MSATHCHAFVALLTELIEFLICKFPDEKELYYTRTQVRNASALNPRVVVTKYLAEVAPYIDQIENQDESFFIDLVETDYDHVLGHLNISQKWQQLSDTEKSRLWKWVGDLTQLSQIVVRV
jgi:hypothetical protein